MNQNVKKVAVFFLCLVLAIATFSSGTATAAFEPESSVEDAEKEMMQRIKARIDELQQRSSEQRSNDDNL
jgi:hypothetical protein